MIHIGYRVVRVSLRSDDDGEIEERGTVTIVHRSCETGPAFGFTVLWDETPKRKQRLQYVAPVRIQTIDDWTAAKKGAELYEASQGVRPL